MKKRTVRRSTKRQSLSVACGQWTPRFFLEEVAHGEIRKAQLKRTYHASASPATAELYLVVGFFLQHVFKIHKSFIGARIGAYVKSFLVEISQRCQFSLCSNDIAAVEELTRTCTDFTENHMVVGLRISADGNLANAKLLAFIHAHFDIDTIGLYQCFNRKCVEGQVTIIRIER